MDTKKIDTLFHGTKKLSDLISIIKNGFYSSYANENFANKDFKIVMVSFSNIPLIEARNQVNYGDYFIGLNRNWGINKKIHPVAYTYQNSQYENDVSEIYNDSLLMKAWMPVREAFKNKKVRLTADDLNPNIENLLNHETLSQETIPLLKEYFIKLNDKIGNMQLYLKHYVTYDKENILRYAYNDREWRYIPDEVQPKIILRKTVSDFSNQLIAKYDKKAKPHFKENPLPFDLNDISFLIVKEKIEIIKVYNTLKKRFGEKQVLKNIIKGDLTILSMDNIWNDL